MPDLARPLTRAVLALERRLGRRLWAARRAVRWKLGHALYYEMMFAHGDTTHPDHPDYFDAREWGVDRGEFRDIAEELARLPGLDAGARVLDVGGGTGLLALALQDPPHGHRVVSCDVDRRALRRARRRGVSCVQADATCLPFRDGAFDAAVSQHLVEHCDPPRAAVEEALRVARAGCVHVVPGHATADRSHVVDHFTPALLEEVFAGLPWRARPDAHAREVPADLDYVVSVTAPPRRDGPR